MSGNTDLFQKCTNFEDAKKVQAAGVYPYFRAIESTSGSSYGGASLGWRLSRGEALPGLPDRCAPLSRSPEPDYP